MHFQLEYDEFGDRGAQWTWRLMKADHVTLAQAPEDSATEDEARAQIAAFRKAAGGMKFAKVLKP